MLLARLTMSIGSIKAKWKGRSLKVVVKEVLRVAPLKKEPSPLYWENRRDIFRKTPSPLMVGVTVKM